MDLYKIDLETPKTGGYFSSEQIDFLKIIQCNSHVELFNFIKNCYQIKMINFDEDYLKTLDLDNAKRIVFKSYQDTLSPYNSDKNTLLENKLKHLLLPSDIKIIKRIMQEPKKEIFIREYIKIMYPNNYKEILKLAHRFKTRERDQNKREDLYEEMCILNEHLYSFNTMLVGCGKPELVINNFFENEAKFDFYYAERDLDFAYKNNKHIRLHSLLTKTACEELFKGKEKNEIRKILKEYVKSTIDFINKYNDDHKLADGTPVINAVDLFNEIVSFNKNEKGEYENIWETNYGITIKDLCEIFNYAKENKPDGVNYLYNEPFLEDKDRREKVKEVLKSINLESNGLIDTIGSQMHISFSIQLEKIKECFDDLKKLQDEYGYNIEITEFDLSISTEEYYEHFIENKNYTYEEAYKHKDELLYKISEIIKSSGVKLNGISYWSLTDKIDCNLERVISELLKKGLIKKAEDIKTVCGGLIPTSKEDKKNLEIN